MTKKKAYVIGTNVSSSLSPAIFEYWFKKYNVNAKYNYKEIKEENFDKEIRLLRNEKDLVGFNITIPYKEKIENYLDDSFQHDWNIGLGGEKLPINCVSVESQNFWNGTNTDWEGAANTYVSFEEKKGKNREGSAFIIGYGGASKAIIYSFSRMGFNQVKVFNRNFSKLKDLSGNDNIFISYQNSELKRLKTKCKISSYKLEELSDHINQDEKLNVIINTTPVNVFDNNKTYKINPKTWGFDIVYRPREGSGFLKFFDPKNRIQGIQMLVYQAAPCFNRWFGIKPDVDEHIFEHLYEILQENK